MELKFNINMLLTPAIATLGIFCFNRFYEKSKTNLIIYFILFFALLSVQMVFGDDYAYQDFESYWTPSQRNQIFNEAQKEILLGHKYLDSAESKCLLLPTPHYRQVTSAAIASCCAGIARGDVRSKCVAVLIGLLAYYLQSVYEQGCAINDDLNQSKFHFEKAEYYQELLWRGEVSY